MNHVFVFVWTKITTKSPLIHWPSDSFKTQQPLFNCIEALVSVSKYVICNLLITFSIPFQVAGQHSALNWFRNLTTCK